MSDLLPLAEAIAHLAEMLRADATMIPFQRRVFGALDQIEAILERGVPLRRLATALVRLGLTDNSAKPLTEAHFRAAVSRARSRRRQKTAAPAQTRSNQTATGQQRTAPTDASSSIFTRHAAARKKTASDEKARPDFSGGLFDTVRKPRA